MPIGTAALVTVGKDLFKKMFLDVYECCKEYGGEKIKQWNNLRKIDNLYKKISLVRKVKTIWQVDKAVDLDDFYCDSHIIIDAKRKRIRRYSDFGIEENIVIQGIAGQGKSMLLRYLCSNELEAGDFLPIFIELRKISKESDLLSRIFISFEALGMEMSESLFQAIVNSGKVILLLDAFDEISDDLKSQVLHQIEDLGNLHERLKIIVTSRPYNSIQKSSVFRVVTLDNLAGNEYKQVIQKISNGHEYSTTLINHIEKHANHIKGLLCTPLMVTLLVLSYKSYQQLPMKLSDFYDSLFQMLLSRHDGTKPGYNRKRGCSIDDGEYRDSFETLCVLSKKIGTQFFSSKIIQDISKKVIFQRQNKANPSEFIDDIVKITCLIIREGDEYRFIHKTVQEYYTASYIQKKPEEWVVEFYRRVLKNESQYEWQQELSFLSEIDAYRFKRFYMIPLLLKRLRIFEKDLDKKWVSPPLPVIAEMYKDIGLCCSEIDNKSISIVERHKKTFTDHFYLDLLLSSLSVVEIRKVIFEFACKDPETIRLFLGKEDTPRNRALTKNSILILSDAIENGCIPLLVNSIQQGLRNTFEAIKEIRNEISKEENISILEGLI